MKISFSVIIRNCMLAYALQQTMGDGYALAFLLFATVDFTYTHK